MRPPLTGGVLILLFAATGVHAEEPASTSPPTASVEERLARAEARIAELSSENEKLHQRLSRPEPRQPPGSLALGEARLRFSGYIDVGFFKASGDGVAYRFDPGKRNHPEFADVPWVFDGDPWSNPVNAQGDSADLGLDRTNIARFDPIQSKGKPTFLINMANVGMVASIGQELLAEAAFNFEPRQGLLGSTGDFLDVDLAYVEWIPSANHDFHVFAGKFESTFGIEYRQRKASDRFNVTPSIISRYTVGTPTGLKVRGSLADKAFTYAVALTNGGMMTERFAHFFNEVDRNALKTGSARLSYQLPLPFFLELGASGVLGPQDGQPDDALIAHQYGADLKLVWEDLTVRAEYLKTVSKGGGLTDAPMLDAEGFYVDGWYQLTPLLGVYLRVDHRSALLLADTNLYVTHTARGTVGLRFDVNFHLAAKLEYLRIQEFRGPEIDDDVFTSSVVLKF